MTRTRIVATAAAVAALLLQSACTAAPAPEAGPAQEPPAVVITPGAPPPPGPTGPPAVGIEALPPVAVGEPADFGGGLVATITDITPIDRIDAQGPGEIAGPGVSVTVVLQNGSPDPVATDGFVVNAYDGQGAPAGGASGPPAAPFRGSLPPGQSATGVYVFQRSGTGEDPTVIEINSSISPRVVTVRP